MAEAAKHAPDVPAALVVDFDFYNVPGASEDLHLAYFEVQQRGPDIFWTPRNGGHWVITRAEDIKTVHNDHTRFSHAPAVSIPPVFGLPPSYPIQVDPPRHRMFRTPLVSLFQPAKIEALAPKVRALTKELIAAFLQKGTCNFVAEFAEVFPIVIFLDFVELPRSDRDRLLDYARQSIRSHTVEERTAGLTAVASYLTPWIEQRREHPGADAISQMVNVEIDGSRIAFNDAIGYAVTVLLGGLDTVTSMLSFIVRFFALNPEHRRTFARNVHDAAFVRRAVEELLRRHGIVNTTRVATHDFEYKDVPFRTGDMVLTPSMMSGLDDRQFANPLHVDFGRPLSAMNGTFDFGPHTCVGAALARREIRIFLEEWFSAIPDFSLGPGTKPKIELGMVNAIRELEIAWQPPTASNSHS